MSTLYEYKFPKENDSVSCKKKIDAEMSTLYECKIFKGDGSLARVVPREEILKLHQMKYLVEGESFFNRSEQLVTRICPQCHKSFETKDRRKKFCINLTCAREFHKEKRLRNNKKNKERNRKKRMGEEN